VLLGELEASFPWGLLVVTDSRSGEQVPEWASNDQQVTLGETVAVLRVLHGDEGEVVVRVWDDLSAVIGDLAFRGSLKIESGLLTVADALGENITRNPDQCRPACHRDLHRRKDRAQGGRRRRHRGRLNDTEADSLGSRQVRPSSAS
jgi:hypothetical protein